MHDKNKNRFEKKYNKEKIIWLSYNFSQLQTVNLQIVVIVAKPGRV